MLIRPISNIVESSASLLLIPLLHRLDRVGPDLHNMLEGVSDINRVLRKVPGINLPHRDGATDET